MTAHLDIPGRRKTAILIASLDDAAAREVLSHLSPWQVEAVYREIATMGEVPEDLRTAVLAEFRRLAGEESAPADGNAVSVGKEAAPASDETTAFVAATVRVEPRHLRQEHPQTIAALLAHVPADQARTLLAQLPGALEVDVLQRLAALPPLDTEVLEALAASGA